VKGLIRAGRPADAHRPAGPRPVLLALRSDVLRAGPPDPAAVAAAAREAGGAEVAVVLVLRMHGFALGLPHPGLLPTARERSLGLGRVAAAIGALRTAGVKADGEIIVTRHSAKAVAGSARRREARVVIVESPPAGRLRRLVEGDYARQLHRRLGGGVRIDEFIESRQ